MSKPTVPISFDELSRIKAIIFDELMGFEQIRDERRALLEHLLVKAGGIPLGEALGKDFKDLDICSGLGHLRPLKHPPHRFTCLFCGGMYDLFPGQRSAFVPPLRSERATDDQLAKEAADWDEGRLTVDESFKDAPEAVPLKEESEPISIRMPKNMLRVLKEVAKKEGIGYQVLMKQWLDDKIREYLTRLKE